MGFAAADFVGPSLMLYKFKSCCSRYAVLIYWRFGVSYRYRLLEHFWACYLCVTFNIKIAFFDI